MGKCVSVLCMSLDKKSGVVLLSITSNVLLLTLKTTAGILTGSVSVLSEAVHSATDLIASLVAFMAIRHSETPPDENHHYGHGRIENLAGVFEGLVLFMVGGWVIVAAVQRILHGGGLELVEMGIVVMIISAVVNFFVSRWLLKVAKETDSRAVEAEGYNLLTDVWGAGGVALGLVAVWITGWTVLDPIIAILIGGLILWTAYRLMSGSIRVLLDESLPGEEIELLQCLITEEIESEPRIIGFHKLRARKSGSHRHIDFHLQLKPETTLREAHIISDALEDRIRKNLPNSDVLIHLEDDRSLRERVLGGDSRFT